MKRNIDIKEISDGKLYGPNDMVKADWTFFALYQEIAKEHARMHARRAIVTRIEESDFGCEGRPDGVIAMDHVYLRYEQESEEFCLMAEDDQLYADHIDENSTVLVTADGKILPL